MISEGQVRQQRLDRDFPLDHRVEGAVHRAHGPAAELGNDHVASRIPVLFQIRFSRR